MKDSSPIAEVDGAAWFPTYEDAECWAALKIQGFPAYRVTEFNGGYIVEPSAYSGQAFDSNGEIIEL